MYRILLTMKRRMMDSLNSHVREYVSQLSKGHIQKAYRGILSFMSDTKTYLEHQYPDYTASAVYPGYMDMTYFAFTPSTLKQKKLKIAIVFLHPECRLEVWLAGVNRQIQAEYIRRLSTKDIGRLTLSQVGPGVDSIIASRIVEKPDFDNRDVLQKQVEVKTMQFIKDIEALLA
jgi:hypothetical protein